jgi:Holliday junction resolvase
VSRYRKGADAERRLRHQLEGYGCVVSRVAGSKGPADLIVRVNGCTYEVQVKYGSSRITRGSRLALFEQAARGGNCAMLAEMEPREETRFYFVEYNGAMSETSPPGARP